MKFQTQTEMVAANESGLYLPLDNGNPISGVAHMANASRFVEANFSEPLTTYALAWRDQEGLQDLIDFVCPAVEVPRRFEYATFVNAEAFNSEADDIRSIGSDFKRVEYSQSKTTSSTLNKGLTIRVDLDNVDQNTNWRERIVSQLQLRVLRNDVRRALALLVAGATEDTGSAQTWDGSTVKDPDMALLTAVKNYTAAAGIPPSNVLLTLGAWVKRVLSHRLQNAAGGFASGGINVNDVAAFIGCQRGIVAKHFYQSLPGAVATPAGTKANLAGSSDIALVFLASPNQSPDDASNIKRFVTQTNGGTMVRVYEQQISMKLVDITVEMYSRPVLTSSVGLRKITLN
jgi:hypothetical protein